MRKPFMDEDFLLSSSVAKKLYHEYAAPMPIFDYHCHLNPKEIADDVRFEDIGQLMLGGDHYKWRAMTAFGLDERLIRGDASFYEKFMAYAKMLPYAIGNPLYHWTHLELQRVFGIYEPLCEQSAKRIWDRANEMLKGEDFSARRLIEKFNVKLICTTDDPVDSLEHHARIAGDASFLTKVLPAFRPDKALKANATGFSRYIEQLSEVSGVSIRRTDDVLNALQRRVDFFHERGARVSDHGLDDNVPFVEPDLSKADRALEAALTGGHVDTDDLEHYKTALLVALGGMYREKGWVQQYHMNAMRNNSARMFERCGPDSGFDSMGDAALAHKLSRLLDAQDRDGNLPKTILYTLNPSANMVLAGMAGNFQSEGVRGKIQFGSAWWFCDTKQGMAEQMSTLASVGLLSTFVGMLTDSRSFVSYPRHEYFRRIFCDLLGEWVEKGEYPEDSEVLGEITRGICYENAVQYFRIAT